MKWKIIRNEEKEIIKYELTPEIYIKRVLDHYLGCNSYSLIMVQVIDGIEYDEFYMNTSNGYTLKDKKRFLENLLING